MSTGIYPRRKPEENDDDELNPSGITPRRHGTDEPMDAVTAESIDFPAYSPTANPSGIPVVETAPSPSRRTSETPNKPATSLTDEDTLRSAVRPRRVDASGSLKANSDELASLENNPAHDTNGRVKSAIINALLEMSGQANRVLSTGRPVDQYGIASVAGAGMGGAVSGAIEPRVDDEMKRKMRIADLKQSITDQLAIQHQQAAIAKEQSEADYERQRPDIEAARVRAQSKAPKPFIIAGKRINYRRPANWDPQTGAADDWEPYEETVDGKPIVDPTKIADANGLTPRDRQRAQLAAANNKFKAAESEKDRTFRADENEKDRGIRRADLREKIRANVEAEKARRTALGLDAERAHISLANAKIEAQKWGVSLNDYLDGLTDNDVEVRDKK